MVTIQPVLHLEGPVGMPRNHGMRFWLGRKQRLSHPGVIDPETDQNCEEGNVCILQLVEWFSLEFVCGFELSLNSATLAGCLTTKASYP